MGFTEALRLVVDADTKGAVQGMEKLGATAERELSRSEKRLDQWGNRLTSLGTGMVAFGGAALVGLGALAKSSEEANLAQVKLQNTIDNMPKLAGASASEFTDLAESIQKVTAADADAIVEAEALLGTFNLTADEIKGITPLVVDYARKFGIDMADAAVQVGKALDGQVGALKRNGVSIDETLFKTDRYRAVQEALSDQVGGFAEAEGKTFAGSLERMKNELGDLAEGVGGGAVDAFTSLFGAVEKGADALESISPGAQNAIGQISTFGAVGLVAAGGLNILVGTAIKTRETIGTIGGAVSATTTKLGGLKSAAGLAAGAAGLAGLILAAKEIGDAADRLNIDKITESLLSTTAAADKANQRLVTVAVGMDRLDSTFRQVLDSSVPAAESFIDTAEALGVEESKLDDLRVALDEKRAADVGGSAAQADYTAEVQEGADAMDDATEAVQTYSDTLKALFDPIFAAVNAQRQLDEANSEVTAAELELIKAIHDHGEGSLEASAATDRLRDAQTAAAQAAVGQQSAVDGLRVSVQNGTTSVADAKTKLYEMAQQGLITAGTAAEVARQFDAIAAAQSRIDRDVAINVVTRSFQIFGAAPQKRAAGGPTAAGQIYQVTEGGRPELLQEGGKTYLLPGQNGQVVPFAAGMAPGGGGAPLEVHSHLHIDGKQLVDVIQRYVRTNHGGDVQTALSGSR